MYNVSVLKKTFRSPVCVFFFLFFFLVFFHIIIIIIVVIIIIGIIILIDYPLKLKHIVSFSELLLTYGLT